MRSDSHPVEFLKEDIKDVRSSSSMMSARDFSPCWLDDDFLEAQDNHAADCRAKTLRQTERKMVVRYRVGHERRLLNWDSPPATATMEAIHTFLKRHLNVQV
jgi:hypothetical protein